MIGSDPIVETGAEGEARKRLATRDEVTRILGEKPTLAAACSAIFDVVCANLGWEWAALWNVDPAGGVLRFVCCWHSPANPAPAFKAASIAQAFGPGAGLPGTVWSTGEPLWIPDVTLAANFPRAGVAAQEGLHGAFAFPIMLGEEILGVMEFFSHEIREPDNELLRMLGSIGGQIGQFIERKRSEQERDRFFHLALDMFCIAGLDGYFKRVNPAFEEVLGFSEAELLARPFLSFVHPDDRTSTLAAMEGLSRGENAIRFENRYLTSDGSYRWLQWNSTLFPAEQLVFAAARDVTEQKQVEEELRKARETAEKASAAKTEFLARMSHEIRTPLNAIIGMADLLSGTNLSTVQREYVRIFQKAGESLLNVLNDVLDLSKVESGFMELESVEFDLRETLEKAAELISIRAHEKGLELVSHIAPDVPTCLLGDTGRLRQVLINLLGNAVKFTEKGEVVLRVERDPEGTGPGALRFSVSDTGIGVPEDKLASIFDAFTQADSSTTRKYGGTGLGLAISRKLVELMNGRIWASRRPGGGSTFYFTAEFRIAPGDPRKSLPEPVDVRGVKMLIVDDNATNRLILSETLTAWGARIGTAENGEEAMTQLAAAKASGEPFSLVLLDCRMPGMDGFTLAELIQRDLSLAGPVILMLTSDNRSGDETRCMQLGLAAYLVKPVKRQQLLESIRAALGTTQMMPQSDVERSVPAPQQSKKPLRILLADDSDENVFLVQAYLQDEGHSIDVAKDGVSAVEKYTSGTYDLVLMDVQMAEMDGHTATRKIREWERSKGLQAVPIIALTAHALKEEVDKSLEAGCTAHLTKPLRKQALVETIRAYGEVGGPTPAGIEVHVDARFHDLVPWFIQKRREDADLLKAALDQGDFQTIQTLGHNMKGTGAAYGLPQITDIGGAIEQAVQSGNRGEIGRLVADLSTYLDRLRIVFD